MCLLAQSSISHRILTLGNSADLPLNHQFYQSLNSEVSNTITPTTIIINGDFTDGNQKFSQDSLKLVQLMATVKNLDHATMILIPGDRDWTDSGPNGWQYVRKLEKFVENLGQPNVFWSIKKGCPGPKEFSLNENLLLVSIQTQWWNHPHKKPLPADADCKIASTEDFNEELEDLIEENGDKNILIAGHFPILSHGPYGGKWPFQKYLFPVPILSGLKPAFHSNVGTMKDLSNHNFSPLKNELEDILEEQYQLIYLSSHEHNLQILQQKDHYLINSGAPSRPGYTGRGRNAIYAESHPGLIELQYFESGQVTAIVHKGQRNRLDEAQVIPLYRSNCSPGPVRLPVNLRQLQCTSPSILNQTTTNEHPDSITIAAGSEYKAGWVKKSWFGKHYRDSWTSSVRIPYLNMDTTFKGLRPFQVGGGRQTTSLKLKAANGEEYVFRSVNKDPTKSLDHEYRETIIGAIVKDQTSTQQPYGALVADKLLNHLDLLHAHPRLFVLPHSSGLGPFEKEYAGLFGMLEERPTNPKKVEKPFADADVILKSHKMFRELYRDHDNKVNTREFIRARVFDLLVGDWGKHEDNWKWAGYRNQRGITFRPIPRDRDHVFSLWDGIIPWLADREWAKPSAANFGYDFKGIKSLMWQARHLDRFLANEADREAWLEAVKFIQQRINSNDIKKAVQSMPVEIYDLDGIEIEEKLNQRLANLDRAAADYYEILSKEVDVVGSNKKEYFQVNRTSDGSVKVSIFDLDPISNGPDSTRRYYSREFFRNETREIRLFGLQNSDYFHVFGKSQQSIPIRIIPGSGRNHIVDDSKVAGIGKKTKVYQRNTAGTCTLGSEAKRVRHWDDDVYDYRRTAFAYNTYLPLAYISSSKDFGLGIKAGVGYTRQRFGKKDYSDKHSIQLAVSTENIFVFSYSGKIRHLIGRWDMSMEALAADHYYFTYFFGIGNDTEKDDDLFDQDYYRTSYNSYQFTAGLDHQFWDGNDSNLSFEIHYENNQEQFDDSTIIKDPEFPQDILGAEDTNIFEVILGLDLDFRNRTSLPDQGMRLAINHQSGLLTNMGNSHYGVSQGSLEGYISTSLRRPITLGVKLGGSWSYGNVPFYKLKYLGQTNNLRGYLRNRFTGKSTVFLNTELRWELSEFRTSWFPIRFGLSGFYDTGRVYSEFDLTNNWHQGYGGGIYFIPVKEEFSLNLSLAYSEEESSLLLLSIGKIF